jgi:hypothetical protein
MLNNLLKANLIEILELKRSKKIKPNGQLNYCKYHCLISHPVEKYFMLKYKIARLNENGDIIFDAEITTLNITTLVNLGFHQSLPVIGFGSLEPMKFDIFFPTSS